MWGGVQCQRRPGGGGEGWGGGVHGEGHLRSLSCMAKGDGSYQKDQESVT